MDSAQLAKLAAVAGVSGAAVALLVAKLLDGGARRAQASVSEDKPEDKPSLPRPLERQASSVVDAHVCSSERVQKFVLTGGPCGGKTTALARLREFFEERGFRVFIAPEAATMLWSNGMSVSDLKSEEDGVAFQLKLMDMQMFLEDTFCELAERTGQRSVVLCDRGTMDGKAYSSSPGWAEVLEAQAIDELELRDSRYNAVLHLTTAANGAESFYESGPDTPRMEGAQAARDLDERIRTAWLGHPNHTVLYNGEGGFEGKLRALIAAVSRLVGLPATGRKARKFLLRPGSKVGKEELARHGVECKTFTIEKCYPLLPGAPNSGEGSEETGYTYVRRRSSEEGFASYGETRVEVKDGETLELKRVLRASEYARMVSHADPARHIVRTQRTCFSAGSLSVYLERFLSPHQGLQVLYVQAEQEERDRPLDLPPPLRDAVEREVTGERQYSAYHLSLAAASPPPHAARARRGTPNRPA